MWMNPFRALTERVIASGQVRCPMRARDVDVDVCGACPEPKQFGTNKGVAYVRCEPAGPDRLLKGQEPTFR